jgi:membrane-associated PAP2 superfamily phosphatase
VTLAIVFYNPFGSGVPFRQNSNMNDLLKTVTGDIRSGLSVQGLDCFNLAERQMKYSASMYIYEYMILQVAVIQAVPAKLLCTHLRSDIEDTMFQRRHYDLL